MLFTTCFGISISMSSFVSRRHAISLLTTTTTTTDDDEHCSIAAVSSSEHRHQRHGTHCIALQLERKTTRGSRALPFFFFSFSSPFAPLLTSNISSTQTPNLKNFTRLVLRTSRFVLYQCFPGADAADDADDIMDALVIQFTLLLYHARYFKIPYIHNIPGNNFFFFFFFVSIVRRSS